MNIIAVLLMSVLLFSCAAVLEQTDHSCLKNDIKPWELNIRIGALSPSDSGWGEANYPGQIPTSSIEIKKRLGDDGRFSIGGGLDFQWATVSSSKQWIYQFGIFSDPEAYIVSAPLLFGVNSATREEWSNGHANIFFGAGIVGYMARENPDLPTGAISASDRDVEWGVGPLLNLSTQIPFAKQGHFILDLRYTHKPVDSDGASDNVGGLEAAVGFGFTF